MARLKTAQPNHSLRKIAAVVATAVSGMSVYAQAAVEPKEETITVTAAPAPQESAWGPAATIAAKHSATATKTDTPIEKTPQSISVVTRQEMEMKQPTTVKEALAYTPGVFSTRGSSTTYDVVTIRGFTTSTTVNTNQYLDGMKLQGNNYSEVSMDPYFLERVEVMRGPTSVLYGNSNPGGIVSMVSKRPTTEPLKEIQFKMGTDNLWQTGFDFSDAIDEDGVWSYRLTGLGRSQDAQQQMAKSTRYAVAPSFSWRPDDKTDFTFLSNFQSDPYAGYYGWLPREGTVVPYYDANGKARISCRRTLTKAKRIIRCLAVSRWLATASRISSMTLSPCVRTCVMPTSILCIVQSMATDIRRQAKSTVRMFAPMRTLIRLPLIPSCSLISLPAR